MSFFKGFNPENVLKAVEKGANSAINELSKVDIGSAATDIKNSVEKGVSGIDIGNIAQGVKDAAVSGANQASNLIQSLTNQNVSNEEGDDVFHEPEGFRECISLYWLLANVDDDITDNEREKIKGLVCELDESCVSVANELEHECNAKLWEGSQEFGRSNAAKIEAKNLVRSLNLNEQEAKLICWNLFALANSDGISDVESDFIRYISKEMGVNEIVFEELRNYSEAIVEIAQKREEIKSSNKTYSEIEPLVTEITKREQIIIGAVQALITDR